MSFGLSIQNAAGDYQIDGDFQNHIIAETGSVAGAPAGINTVVFAGSYLPSRLPLLFGRSASHVGFRNWNFSGSNIVGFDIAVMNGEGGNTFFWKLAVTPAADSGDTFGLRVFNAAGALVFDAGHEYLKLIDAIAVSFAGFGTGNKAHASATNPYYCLNSGASRGLTTTIPAAQSGHRVAVWQPVSATAVHLNWATPSTVPADVGINGPFPAAATLLVSGD